MRLTTLARKIDKTPNQLIAFLKENDIDVSNGLHGKLESETVELVLSRFSPNQSIEELLASDKDIEIQESEETPSLEINSDSVLEDKQIIEEIEFTDETVQTEEEETTQMEETIQVEETAQVEETEIEVDAPEEEVKVELKTGTVDDLEIENLDEIELIRAKKVKLEGIKVIGKIDLPEKVKKEIAESQEDKGEIEKPEKPRRNLNSGNRNFDRNRKKNTRGRNREPLSYDERLKKEEREKLQERRKLVKEEKRRKKKYYQKNLQAKNTPKVKKKKKSQGEYQSQEKVHVHKNPIRRLWAWLNGKYDRY